MDAQVRNLLNIKNRLEHKLNIPVLFDASSTQAPPFVEVGYSNGNDGPSSKATLLEDTTVPVRVFISNTASRVELETIRSNVVKSLGKEYTTSFTIVEDESEPLYQINIRVRKIIR